MSATPVTPIDSAPAWVRAEFPALRSTPDIAYLDNASTTQKPRPVIDAVARALGANTASPGRGRYPWATRLSAELARVRARTAAFLGAGDPAAIVFTAGATASMNAVAFGWGLANLVDGDAIGYCRDDHTSTVAPWINLRDILARFGVTIRLVPYERTALGEIDPRAVVESVGERTRLIVISHVHGVNGARTSPAELRAMLDPSILLCVDCSQSAGHLPVDVTASGADFAVVSGHKMFAAPGVGVLYCAPRTHSRLRPFLPGGAGDRSVADRLPALLEGGTPDMPAIASLGAAIDFIDRIGLDAIAAHTAMLTLRVFERLDSVPGIQFRSRVTAASGIVALRLADVRPGDVDFVLAGAGIYVRAGGHCVRGVDADVIRISMHAYNTRDEIDRACELLARIAEEGG